MHRKLLALNLIASLVAAPLQMAAAEPAATSRQPLPALTAELRADLHCAAAFAVAASEQQRGTAAALALPPMAVRGKRYFADVAERVLRKTGLDRDAVRDLLVADVVAMQRRATVDPDGELTAEVKPCLARLDAEVPPLQIPDLAQCAAILGLAFEEERLRDPQSPAARDLQTLAQVLASRARTAAIAAGASGDGADAALEQARDAMRSEAQSRPGGVDNYAIAQCYDLAAPDAKSHY
ncbi:MAG: hypothetical protein ACKVOL_05080 [Novosphingobium sp.]